MTKYVIVIIILALVISGFSITPNNGVVKIIGIWGTARHHVDAVYGTAWHWAGRYFVTAAHVIQGMQYDSCKIGISINNKFVPVTLVGMSATNDTAVVYTAEPIDLPELKNRIDTTLPKPGSYVVFSGYPADGPYKNAIVTVTRPATDAVHVKATMAQVTWLHPIITTGRQAIIGGMSGGIVWYHRKIVGIVVGHHVKVTWHMAWPPMKVKVTNGIFIPIKDVIKIINQYIK